MSAVLVTGAAKRIGRAFALALAADGRPVAIHCHRSRAEAAALADTIAAAGGTATVIVGDLAEPGAVAALIPTAATALGPITAVVNSASSFVFDDLATLAPATFERQMRVNLLAPLLLSRDLVAQLPPGSAGNVVNLLDQKVGFPLPDYLSYSLTKFGLANATAMLARELAPQVRVNAIAPGLTLPSGTQTEAEFRDAHARTPLARGNQLEDLVAALRYLLDAPAVSGQTLFVDGGQHLRPAADPTLEG